MPILAIAAVAGLMSLVGACYWALWRVIVWVAETSAAGCPPFVPGPLGAGLEIYASLALEDKLVVVERGAGGSGVAETSVGYRGTDGLEALLFWSRPNIHVRVIRIVKQQEAA